MSRTPFSNVNNIHVHSMIPEDQKKMTTQWCSTGRPFTAATQALNETTFHISCQTAIRTKRNVLQMNNISFCCYFCVRRNIRRTCWNPSLSISQTWHTVEHYLNIIKKNKNCSKKKCCKPCRQVKFTGTMTKWTVQKPTHKPAQNSQNNKS